jgi:predicted  nucleic acid-binding Zn-ribbon protein
MGDTAEQKQARAAEKQADISQEQLNLQKRQQREDNKAVLREYERDLYDIDSQIAQFGIDLKELQSQQTSYSDWLAGYQDMYDLQTNAKNAEIAAFKSAGQESFENFMNAIGYADASAAARGLVGAGTSAAAVGSDLDRKLVDYVGEDRTLDGNGGLYGTQLKVQEDSLAQLQSDLASQEKEMRGNLENVASAITTTNTAITTAKTQKTDISKDISDLQSFIDSI